MLPPWLPAWRTAPTSVQSVADPEEAVALLNSESEVLAAGLDEVLTLTAEMNDPGLPDKYASLQLSSLHISLPETDFRKAIRVRKEATDV